MKNLDLYNLINESRRCMTDEIFHPISMPQDFVDSFEIKMEQPIDIKLEIPSNTHVNRIDLNTEQIHIDCSKNGILTTRRGHFYYIPITDKKLNYNTGFYIQPDQKIVEHSIIKNIENGYVTIESIRPGIFNNDQIIGRLM